MSHEDVRQVIRTAVNSCIQQPGVYVNEIHGLGTIIGETELDEEERAMLADFTEALRVKRFRSS